MIQRQLYGTAIITNTLYAMLPALHESVNISKTIQEIGKRMNTALSVKQVGSNLPPIDHSRQPTISNPIVGAAQRVVKQHGGQTVLVLPSYIQNQFPSPNV